MEPHVNGQAVGPKTYTNASWDTRLSIAVDPVALITTECITVTSAMRKHARWAHSSVSTILGGGPSMGSGRDLGRIARSIDKNSPSEKKRSTRAPNGVVGENDTLASRWGLRGKKGKSMQDNPLLSAFARLRNDLRGCTGQSYTKRLSKQEAYVSRYPKLRYSVLAASFPTSNTFFFDLGSYHVTCNRRNNQVLRVQLDQQRLPQTLPGNATTLRSYHALPI